MIAVITSCINPFNTLDVITNKSSIPLNDRLLETINTIACLTALEFTRIYLIDNSYSFDFSKIPKNERLIIKHTSQYQFKNKGINEILLLLDIIKELPEDEPIFKISGRYYTNQQFDSGFSSDYDFKIKAYNYLKKEGTVSTRAYFVRNRDIYKNFLLECLNELFIYSYRIVGIRSAFKSLRDIFQHKTLTNPNTSIEVAFAQVLKSNNYRIKQVTCMGIQGRIAGFEPIETISE